MVSVLDFYNKQGGDQLVEQKNYPPKIKEYLEKEKSYLKKIASKGCYKGIFEIGCMDGRYIEFAGRNKLKYIGIDLVPKFIEKAKEKIRKSNMKDMSAHVCSINSLGKIQKKLSPNIIGFFPFNSFGNLENPSIAIRELFKTNIDFVIFTYKTDLQTHAIRKKYYESCNYDGLKINVDNKGVIFSADQGLNTYAYFEEHIKDLCKNKYVEVKEFSTIGKYYWIRQKGSS